MQDDGGVLIAYLAHIDELHASWERG